MKHKDIDTHSKTLSNAGSNIAFTIPWNPLVLSFLALSWPITNTGLSSSSAFLPAYISQTIRPCWRKLHLSIKVILSISIVATISRRPISNSFIHLIIFPKDIIFPIPQVQSPLSHTCVSGVDLLCFL